MTSAASPTTLQFLPIVHLNMGIEWHTAPVNSLNRIVFKIGNLFIGLAPQDQTHRMGGLVFTAAFSKKNRNWKILSKVFLNDPTSVVHSHPNLPCIRTLQTCLARVNRIEPPLPTFRGISFFVLLSKNRYLISFRSYVCAPLGITDEEMYGILREAFQQRFSLSPSEPLPFKEIHQFYL